MPFVIVENTNISLKFRGVVVPLKIRIFESDLSARELLFWTCHICKTSVAWVSGLVVRPGKSDEQ